MEIALVALSVLSMSLLIGLISTVVKLKKMSDTLSSIIMAFDTINQIKEDTSQITKTEDDIHKENFIKFLSDSRDWAFDYIESVQSRLKDFIDKVEPHLNHYNRYGIVVEGMIPPHDFALITITQEFAKLKTLLPEENNDRR